MNSGCIQAAAPRFRLSFVQKLEEIALQDEYFVKRKLYPNVDFYSGIVLRAIGDAATFISRSAHL
eukprot:6179609-Pleurochrysis_carterae.AAC.2